MNFGLEVIVPNDKDRVVLHRIIYEELVRGIINPLSRAIYKTIIERLIDDGAEAIILGCTEIMMLITQDDCAVPIFDSTTLHAQAAVEFSLQMSGLIELDL